MLGFSVGCEHRFGNLSTYRPGNEGGNTMMKRGISPWVTAVVWHKQPTLKDETVQLARMVSLEAAVQECAQLNVCMCTHGPCLIPFLKRQKIDWTRSHTWGLALTFSLTNWGHWACFPFQTPGSWTSWGPRAPTPTPALSKSPWICALAGE